MGRPRHRWGAQFDTANTDDPWWVNDQTPDNPYGKGEDYEAFLDYLGAPAP